MDAQALTLGLLALVFVPLGLLAAITTTDLKASLRSMSSQGMSAWSAVLDFGRQAPDAVASGQALLGRMMQSEPAPETWTLLPPAPEGWIRVTPGDARQADPFAGIAARWPGGADALRAHPAHENIAVYLNVYDEPGLEEKYTAYDPRSALYLHADGMSFRASLEPFLQGSDVGFTDGLSAATAAAERSAGRSSLQSVERVRLGDLAGMRVIEARQQPQGLTRLIDRMTGGYSTAAGPMEVYLPLGPHGMLTLEGSVSLATADAVVRAMPMDEIAARMAHPGP